MNRSRRQQQVTINDSGKSRFSRYCGVHLCRQKFISHRQKAEPFFSSFFSSLPSTIVWRRRPMRPKGQPFTPCVRLVRTHFTGYLALENAKASLPTQDNTNTAETRTSTSRVGYEPTISVYQRRKALTATGFGRQSSVRILTLRLPD